MLLTVYVVVQNFCIDSLASTNVNWFLTGLMRFVPRNKIGLKYQQTKEIKTKLYPSTNA